MYSGTWLESWVSLEEYIIKALKISQITNDDEFTIQKKKKSENIWRNKLPVSEKEKKNERIEKAKETSNVLFTKSYNDV